MFSRFRRLSIFFAVLLLSIPSLQAPTLAAQQPPAAGCAFVKGSGPTIYFMESGSKRPIPDWDTYLSLGGKPDLSNVCTIPDDQLAAIPTGSPASGPAAPPAASSGGVLLSDNFDDPASGRLPRESPAPAQVLVGYVDGEYMLKKVDPAWELNPIAILPDIYANTALIVDARLVGGTERRYVMLGCRQQQDTPPWSHYRFSVFPATGRYRLDRWDNDQEVQLAEAFSPAVKLATATNRLELSCSGATIAAKINGTELVSVRDNTYSSGRMWIGVGGPVGLIEEARFDNLVVTER